MILKRRAVAIFVISVSVIVGIFVSYDCAYAEEAIESGSCGSNVTWTLTGTGNELVLTISGTGAMSNKYDSTSVPWADYRNRISEIVIDDGITTIGQYAFYGINNVGTVVIPDSVVTISDHAFENCTGLEEIDIPNSVISLGQYVFAGCSSLINITIPENITRLKIRSFYECTNLQSVIIPESVETIDSSVFWGCSNLEEVQLPHNLNSLGSYAFYSCNSLRSIVIPENVRIIGTYTFNNCKNLTRATLPERLLEIQDSAFYYCEKLTSLNIPETVTVIGNYAFKYCRLLVIICDNGSYAQRYAVENSLKYDLSTGHTLDDGSVTLEPTCVTTGIKTYTCQTCQAKIQETLETVDSGHDYQDIAGTGVNPTCTEEGKKPDRKCSKCGKIEEGGIIEATDHNYSEQIVDEKYFKSAASRTHPAVYYKSCHCGESSEGISDDEPTFEYVSSSGSCGDNANYCTFEYGDDTILLIRGFGMIKGGFGGIDFNEVIIENGITGIGNYAFYMRASLTNITIPNSVTSIGDRAFYECTSLASIMIPDSVTSIDEYAFSQCDSLTSITLPNHLTSISDCTFYSCSSLTSITIPDSVTSIGKSAFSCCDSLTSITLPNHLTSINDNTFGSCFSLKSITIPDSVTSIGEIAFYNCDSLTNITIPDSVTSIGDSAFYHCDSLISVSIPDSVTSVGDEAFRWCYKLQIVTIPDSVISIGDYAFEKIRCSENSFAQSYAIKNSIPYDLLSGHQFIIINDFDASCYDKGYREYECKTCHAWKQDIIPKKQHEWKKDMTIIWPATCQEEGYGYIECSLCGSIKPGTEKIIPKVPHEYGSWEIIDVSCYQDGAKVRRCNLCGSGDWIITEPAKNKHTWRDITWNQDILDSQGKIIGIAYYKTKECSVCGYYDEQSTEEIKRELVGNDHTNTTQKKAPDGTSLGEGASAEVAEKAIKGMKSDADLPGSVFKKIQLKSGKQSKTSVTLTWKKTSRAKKYVIYGNKCGKSSKMKKLATSTGSTRTFTKIAGKKVKKGTYYKFMIVALDKNNNVVSSSKIIHVATKGGKVGNYKSVSVKKSVIAKAKKLKKGKTLKLNAKGVKASSKLKVKKHRVMMYESSNPKIATVTKKGGVVKGKKKGTCYIYAYAQNGVFKKIKVTVK